MVNQSENGFVIADQSVETWVYGLSEALELYLKEPEKYQQMRQNSRNSTIACGDWDEVLDDLLGPDLME